MPKGYIAPVKGRAGSLIKYFAIPNGIIQGVVQDWYMAFHVGANKLNDCIWTPSFSLPTINSLLQIVKEHTLMANRDMGEMFLNFNLYPDTVKYACINIGPLFTPKECPNHWMCWTCNMMGFKALPYNLVCMYLVRRKSFEEIGMTNEMLPLDTLLSKPTRHKELQAHPCMGVKVATLYALLITSK